MNKYQQFIKDLYDGQIGNINDKCKIHIANHFPEIIKTKLVVGGWYKNYNYNEPNTPNTLFCYQGFFEAYGFKNDEFTKFHIPFQEHSNFIPASRHDVENALVKESEKRGYLNNNRIILIEGMTGTKSDTLNKEYTFKWYPITGVFQVMTDGTIDEPMSQVYTIFKNGIWADIVENPKTDREENKLILLHEGYFHATKSDFLKSNIYKLGNTKYRITFKQNHRYGWRASDQTLEMFSDSMQKWNLLDDSRVLPLYESISKKEPYNESEVTDYMTEFFEQMKERIINVYGK